MLKKLLIIFLKVIPMMLAGLAFSNTVCSYYEIDTEWMHYVGGTSVLTLIFLYMASYVFKFCEYHRIFIHYVLILEILTTVKWYYPVIVTSQLVLNISFVLSGLLMLCVVFFNVYKIYKKYRRPSN
jgi:hypothetical protein